MLVTESSNSKNYGHNCSGAYSNFYENGKYVLQCFYLIPTLFLLIWIVLTVTVRHRAQYFYNLPYWIFTADCLVSAHLILLDLLIVRLFLYFPQLCQKYSIFFIEHPIVSHIYYPIYNYARIFKTVTQCGLILSRLFCVLFPFGHEERTRRHIPIFLLIIYALPLIAIWNTVISEKDVIYWYGGFLVIYCRSVEWISLSMLHLIFILLAIIFILVSSLILMRGLPEDTIASAERTVVTSTTFVTVAFFLQALFQSYHAVFRSSSWFPSWIVDWQFIIYDVMTVGNPILFLNFAQEFRQQVFLQTHRKSQGLIEFRSLSKASKAKKCEVARCDSPNPNFGSILQ